MARGYTTRKLEVWSLHARTHEGPIPDYGKFLRRLAKMKARERVWESEEKAVALPDLRVKGEKAWLVAYEGPRGQPIVFDVEDATERTQPLGPGEIVATRTHALIDLRSREVIVEYNHRGAKAGDIAVVLGASGRKLGMSGLYVDLSPKVDHSFVANIDQFERIRVAGFRIARPNQDWTDWSDEFAKSAAASDAHSAQAEYNAPKGKSLSKQSGVVPFIRERASDGIAALKNAFVTGRRSDESAETTVTLGDHKEHRRVSVRLDPDGQLSEADILKKFEDYDEERDGKRDDGAGE